VARLKGEARMAAVVAHAVRTRQRPLRQDVDLPYGSTILRLTTRPPPPPSPRPGAGPGPTTPAAVSSSRWSSAVWPTTTSAS